MAFENVSFSDMPSTRVLPIHSWPHLKRERRYSQLNMQIIHQYSTVLGWVFIPKGSIQAEKNMELEKTTAFLLETLQELTGQSREPLSVSLTSACLCQLPEAPCRILVLPFLCSFVSGFVRNLNSSYVYNKSFPSKASNKTEPSQPTPSA